MNKISQPFRAWTRGTSFTINMGKTQVITLVAIGVSREKYVGLLHPQLRHYVTAVRGLQDRGLVRRPRNFNPKPMMPRPLVSIMEPTEAGDHILSLLKIAGVYDELKSELLSYEWDKDTGMYHQRFA